MIVLKVSSGVALGCAESFDCVGIWYFQNSHSTTVILCGYANNSIKIKHSWYSSRTVVNIDIM